MILVTGGAGFIGSNIVARLAADGADVAVCDWLGHENKWRNIAKADIADMVLPDDLGTWLKGKTASLEAIVHMGAISSTTERDADLILRNNVHLSRLLWEFASDHRIPFIYASSAATYGDGTSGFDDAFDRTALGALRPLNAYGWSKLFFDRLVAREIVAKRAAPPQWAGLRFFNVYGPNEYHKGSMRSVAVQLHEQISANGAAHLFKSYNAAYPDGGQKRDFVYVKDCADVVAWLIANPRVSGLFNLGTGKARSFADLATAAFAALNREAHIRFIDMPDPLQAQYQYFTEARMERLRAAGYTKPFTSLEDGVADYLRNYLATSDPYL